MQLYILILVKVSCNPDISMINSYSPNCNLCPKGNDSLNMWCGGSCFYDEENDICKEGKIKPKWKTR